MKKSDILAALGGIPGDPEIEVRVNSEKIRCFCKHCEEYVDAIPSELLIDRINEFPRPEIVVIEK